MKNRTKVAKKNEKKYFQLLNVVDDVLLSAENGQKNDWMEGLSKLAELVNELTGLTLQQRFGIDRMFLTGQRSVDIFTATAAAKNLKHNSEAVTTKHYTKAGE